MMKKPTREKLIERLWNNVIKGKGDECWLFIAATVHGYGRISNVGAHRLSYEIHKGEIPKGMFVCHKCDVRACVNPDHLFLGTHYDNLKDMTDKGRRAMGDKVANKGQDHPNAKLTNQDVLDIREARGKLTSRQIAYYFGLKNHNTVKKIWKRELWKHL